MIIVKTESGSTYELCEETMTWRRYREKPDLHSPLPVRTKDGKLTSFPKIVVGESMTLWCPPYVEGAHSRALFTSVVVEATEG